MPIGNIYVILASLHCIEMHSCGLFCLPIYPLKIPGNTSFIYPSIVCLCPRLLQQACCPDYYVCIITGV